MLARASGDQLWGCFVAKAVLRKQFFSEEKKEKNQKTFGNGLRFHAFAAAAAHQDARRTSRSAGRLRTLEERQINHEDTKHTKGFTKIFLLSEILRVLRAFVVKYSRF